MQIALHGKTFKEESIPYLQNMFDILHQRGAKLAILESFKLQLERKGIKINKSKTYSTPEELGKCDFVFSLGGDGTLLEAITFVREKQIPILGINTGRLGFLATTQQQDIEKSINDLFEKNYSFDERSLIHLDNDLFNGENFGLNEFSILKKDTSSMIVVHTYIDGEYLNSYWADGLLISTPTGSTGYSLSCGGPLVVPHSNSFIIAPVSPHNLNVRPMVVSDTSVISFKIEGRSKNILVALDSRSKSVSTSTHLSVRKEKFKARLVQLKSYNFFETLRGKLNWGLDLRN